MDNDFRLRMTFWGVRGSTPTPQIKNLNYGGNTCCIEVRLPNNEVFIFDAGSGVRDLGDSLLEEFSNQKLDLKVFLTHFHWDHIQGIPFFQPLYQAENKVVFHSVVPMKMGQKHLQVQLLLGFFGFPPFALECYLLYRAFLLFRERFSHGQKLIPSVTAVLVVLFCLLTFMGIDRWTVEDYKVIFS